MSKRQVIILWSTAAILAAVLLIVKLAQSGPDQTSTKRKAGDTLFESFPAEDITQVVIEGAKQSLTLKKVEDQWVVVERDNYPADTTAVLELIRTLARLEINRSVEAEPKLAPRFGMDPDSQREDKHGIEIGFFGKGEKGGKELARVTLGKTITSNASGNPLGAGQVVGRYIRNHADESGFYAVNEMFPSISDEANLWLRDVFISPEKIESVKVSATDSDETEWHLSRVSEEAVFHVVDGKPTEVANANLARLLGNLFAYARFKDVVPVAELEQIQAKEGRREAIIETFEGFTYRISLVPSTESEQDYLMSVEVDADLPSQRKAGENEDPELAAQLDEGFTKRLRQLQDKLREAKFFEGRTYLLSKSDVNVLLYDRGEMVNVIEIPKPPANPNPPKPQESPKPAQP